MKMKKKNVAVALFVALVMLLMSMPVVAKSPATEENLDAVSSYEIVPTTMEDLLELFADAPSFENIASTLASPQPGDTISLPTDFVAARAITMMPLEILLSNILENTDADAQTLEDISSMVKSPQPGDIISVPVTDVPPHIARTSTIYLSPEAEISPNSFPGRHTPWCQNGRMWTTSTVIGEDFRFSHMEGSAHIWVCYNHRVRIEEHCSNCGLVSSGVVQRPGCGARMVIR